MSNILGSLYTSVAGLKVNQTGMSVVSANIANMNTEGYSKQRIDIQSVSYRATSASQLMEFQSGGVSIEGVTRYQDDILNGFILQEYSAYGYDQQKYANLSAIEGYMNEIDNSGLTGAFNDYFKAAQSLANDPTNKIARANFVYQAENVAKEFNSKYESLSSYRANLAGDGVSTSALKNSQVGNMTEEINSKIEQICELNRQISVFSNQENVKPNSLLDKRQLLLEDLSQQIPITLRNEGSAINIYLGNVQLTRDAKQLAELKVSAGGPASLNPAVVSIVDKENPVNVFMADYRATLPNAEGTLKAILDVTGDGENSISDYLSQLDTLAQVFAEGVNDIQLKTDAGPPTQAALKLNPTTGQLEVATQNIFLNSPATNATYDPTLVTAQNISINAAVKADPFEVSTAFGEVAGAVVVSPNAVGNNNNALSFLNMRQNKLTADSLTVEDKLYLIESQVGNASALAKSNLDTQQNSLQQLNDKKQSLVGVSLDEELVDLIKYQKAYQASAKVFSTVSQMMEVIVNMVR